MMKIVLLLILLSIVKSYKNKPLISSLNNKRTNNNNIISKYNTDTKLYMEIPLIPTALVAVGLTFAIFNLENPTDLTDQGLAKARLQRRKEKIEKGEIIQPNNNLDPYRWKIFEDGTDEDDLELIANGGKKKTGGCG